MSTANDILEHMVEVLRLDRYNRRFNGESVLSEEDYRKIYTVICHLETQRAYPHVRVDSYGYPLPSRRASPDN
jgi:hypothetical protein